MEALVLPQVHHPEPQSCWHLVMSNKPQDRPHVNAVLDPDPFAYASDSWAMHGCDQPSSLPTHPPRPAQPSHQAIPSSATYWTTLIDPAFQHHGDADAVRSADDMEPHNFNATGTGTGIGRLVAHFENKSYTPPLPLRPTQPHSHTHAHQPMPSHFGSFHYVAQLNRAPSPFIDADAPQFGSLDVDICSSATRPTSIDRTNHPYDSLHDPHQRSHGPVMASSSPFGSLDGSLNPDRVISHIVAQPVASGPMATTLGQPTPSLPGTPGFEIWRAPDLALAGHKPLPASILRSTGFSNYSQPPALTIPKPAMTVSNRFILEFNPAVTTRAKAPAKPPRPRVAPRKSSVAQSISRIQESQATKTPVGHRDMSINPAPAPSFAAPPKPLLPTRPARSSSGVLSSPTALLAQRTEITSLRGSTGTRPSREQVPAEAWERFKPTIRALYLEERKPLKEIINIMAEKYGFQATPKMYKTRFSQWGFVKNNTEDEVKRLLSMKFQRDAEGKVSEFVRNGRVVNLGTYLKRKGVTEYDLVDFELPADLPTHVCCRTPTPPLALKSPDTVRLQEVVVGNMRKVFLHCRQFEIETGAHIGWKSCNTWGAWSSELLLEANFYLEGRDVDQGGKFLMRAFKQLEMDLRSLSPQGMMEMVWAMVNRDPGMVTALCKYLSAYSMTNLDRSHPLRLIFSCLYEVQQKHGAKTLSELLDVCISPIAEELQAIYGRRHPYVARTWADLAQFYNQRNAERLDEVVREVRHVRRQIERQQGVDSNEAVALLYVLLQLQYFASPQSELTKQMVLDMWTSLRRIGVLHRTQGPGPPMYCYHSVAPVNSSTKRCRRRYTTGNIIFEAHMGIKILPYFPEDFHAIDHALEPQDAWACALEQGDSHRHWEFF